MAKTDPFTLDLFGGTALSSGLGLDATAVAGGFATDADDGECDPTITAPAMLARAATPRAKPAVAHGRNFHLEGDRGLHRGWKARARDNVAAIRLAADLEAAQRPATADEQAQLIRFIGFGASDLAGGIFRRPGEATFRPGWEEIGAEL
ncbi:hypothetical protein BVIR_2043 [Blastochloris viridis]|uniref:DNA methylase n=1 Tax=Blastochloris viridis TaxID=1079 RepID=A0A0H5BGL4_BLAVI|nr:hypothetical protein BVIR_2043 [Blastochloris viridis]BAS00285.1 hypothetical protein BV133_2691 [Blastochloris viridis]CUU42476.1 DNA methylase [Blastochloris viridis]